MNQIKSGSKSLQRNYGIDLLRLVAAFYIVVLHAINQGGILAAVSPYSYQDTTCRALLLVTYCAVNIFGIISGYVGYREPLKKFSFSGYISLWTTVVFYCLLFAAYYGLTMPGSVTGADLVHAVTPVTSHVFWYFSDFTLVYFLSPFLNKAISHSSEKELNRLFILICCVLVPIEYINHPFYMGDGYSALWLLLLYLIGGIVKKNELGKKIPSYMLVLSILVIDLVFFYLRMKYTRIPFSIFELNFKIQRTYITPFYLAAAILHVILFSRFRFGPFLQKIIAFAAPAAFSVYIVNTNPLLWKYFLKDRYVSWSGSSPAGIIVYTVLASAAFTLAVVLLDLCRRKLFRLMGVQNWESRLSAFFGKNKAA